MQPEPAARNLVEVFSRSQHDESALAHLEDSLQTLSQRGPWRKTLEGFYHRVVEPGHDRESIS